MKNIGTRVRRRSKRQAIGLRSQYRRQEPVDVVAALNEAKRQRIQHLGAPRLGIHIVYLLHEPASYQLLPHSVNEGSREAPVLSFRKQICCNAAALLEA